jgi:hypothetical protein
VHFVAESVVKSLLEHPASIPEEPGPVLMSRIERDIGDGGSGLSELPGQTRRQRVLLGDAGSEPWVDLWGGGAVFLDRLRGYAESTEKDEGES